MNSYNIYLQNTTVKLLLSDKTDKTFQIKEFSDDRIQILFNELF